MITGINIKGTYDTPTVDFNPATGKFSIEGRSLPSNSFDFFAPVMEQVRAYLEQPSIHATFSFKMDFISSSSTKIFQELFHLMEQAYLDKKDIKASWYYRFGDDDMKELGDDLRADATFPFEYVAFE